MNFTLNKKGLCNDDFLLKGKENIIWITNISIVPLEILVAMCRAWKKDVFSGPSPVFPGGTKTSTGAKAPALAGAPTYNSYIIKHVPNRTHTIKKKTLNTLNNNNGYQKEGSIVSCHHILIRWQNDNDSSLTQQENIIARGQRTLLSSIMSRISFKSPLVKTNPTFPLTCGSSFSNWGLLSIALRMIFLKHLLTITHQ